jgi:hypothetical protein
MSRVKTTTFVRYGLVLGAFVILTTIAPLTASAEPSPSDQADVMGRVEFDFEGAPPATIEVDLSHGMLSDVAGIGQAAVGGVVEALIQSGGSEDSSIQQSAEHLEAVNQILSTLSGVVHEVRVRVYENAVELAQPERASMISHYQQKLNGTDWDNVVRVREGEGSVVVCTLRSGGAIRGLFVMVSEHDDLVIANVVCELTPDKVKQVTNQATRIGMKFGLKKVIQDAMRGVNQRHAEAAEH